MMPNGRAGATPGRVVEVEAAAMVSIPTTGVGIGAAGREAAAMVSMPATGAGIGTAGRGGVGMDPLEDPPRGEFSWTAMMREGVGMDGHDTEGERAFT